MPRKIRQLKSELRKAGFYERTALRKGSHTQWFTRRSLRSPSPFLARTARTLATIKNRRCAGLYGVCSRLSARRQRMDRAYGELEVTDEDRAAASRYAAVIEWSDTDGVYVVTVPDIPNLHTHGATREA